MNFKALMISKTGLHFKKKFFYFAREHRVSQLSRGLKIRKSQNIFPSDFESPICELRKTYEKTMLSW